MSNNEKKSSGRGCIRRLALWGLIAILAVTAIGIIFGDTEPEEQTDETTAGDATIQVAEGTAESAPTEEPEPTETPGPTNTPEPTATPLPPTETPEPTATLEPIRELESQLLDTIGESNRDVSPRLTVTDADGTVEITWAINDNLTENMIRDGAKVAIRDMLEVMANTDYPYDQVIFRGTFSLVDQFGNSSEETVVTATYNRETVERINFENFLFEDVYNIADDIFLHPVMRE